MAWRRDRRAVSSVRPTDWSQGGDVTRGVDAPMGPRDIRLFRALFGLVAIVVVAIIVISLTQ